MIPLTGGGPDFSPVFDDERLVECRRRSRYLNPDHEKMCGSGYKVTFTFKGLKPGRTRLVIEERSPIVPPQDHINIIEVGDDLSIALTPQKVREID